MNKILRVLKDKDLRRKMLVVLGIFVVFRLAAAVPIPGVDANRLQAFLGGNDILGLLNLFSGGGLETLSIVMLGVGPYITASIIMQLLTMVFPRLKEMYQEEGEAGRQRFNQYSRFLTVPLAMLQGYGLLTILARQGIFANSDAFHILPSIIIVTAGSLFVMWLGELITEYGIGNGVSLMIFAGIVAQMPTSVAQTFTQYSTPGFPYVDPAQLPTILIVLALSVLVVAGVVFITEGQRPIPVSYAKRVRGQRVYGGFSTYLPLRVNQAGVIPIIFALSILLFPQFVGSLLTLSTNSTLHAIGNFFTSFLTNQWLYGSFYFLLVFLFTYFYTSVTFDPQSIADNLQKSGGFIPGIRPGKPTTEFLSHVINRITLAGAFFLGIIAVLPLIVQSATGVSTITLGGTALLIVVSVVLETIKQIEGQLVMREYD